MATIHIVSFTIDEDYRPTIEDLEAKYPGIAKKMKRGDIIENINDTGYRSCGSYMYNGEEVIERNFEYDDYGSPSIEFKLITEFAPGYWDQSLNEQMLNTIAWEKGAETEFYWHDDNTPCVADPIALNLATSVNNAVKVDYIVSGHTYTQYDSEIKYDNKTYPFIIHNVSGLMKLLTDGAKHIYLHYDCGNVRY
jgi:hypothetical protein